MRGCKNSDHVGVSHFHFTNGTGFHFFPAQTTAAFHSVPPPNPLLPRRRGAMAAAAASYFSGSAFIPSQRAGSAAAHEYAASGAATPSPSKSRGNPRYSGCVPATVRHIARSLAAAAAAADVGGDPVFSIDGFKTSNVRVLGKVETVVSGETDVSFTLDDGTGKIPLVRWITDEADARDAAFVKAGVYIRVHVDITGFQANQQGFARSIR
uniref:Uncharacterized protein n=1 Tax=Avena sativa TaxID=4498 RepID=A0ACD6ATN1_AVESA